MRNELCECIECMLETLALQSKLGSSASFPGVGLPFFWDDLLLDVESTMIAFAKVWESFGLLFTVHLRISR